MNRQQKHEEWMEEYYRRNEGHNIGDIRSALGDAAGLCDAISTDIEEACKPRTKLRVQRAKDLSDAVKKAGDAIWAMRDRVLPNRAKGSEGSNG